MEILKVKIIKNIFGYAIGKNINGETVFVKNGDLKKQTEIECIFTKKKGRYLISEIFETYENEKLLKNIIDSANLVNTNIITKLISCNLFLIDNKWFFPDRRITKLIEYLMKYPILWSHSKINLNIERSSYNRVKTFGITFQEAIKKLANSGFSKARLYCENKQDFSKEGVIAEMLANTYEDKDGYITLEIWQGVENANEVFYSHGIMNKEKNMFTHFDCAVIDYNIRDKEQLFKENKKIKSGHYKKLFRLDGTFEIYHIIEIANRFFPLDNLTEEYFEIEKI